MALFFLSLTLALAAKEAFQRFVSLQMSMNISRDEMGKI